jgi:hypothetical protein
VCGFQQTASKQGGIMKQKHFLCVLSMLVIVIFGTACSASNSIVPPSDTQPGQADDAESAAGEQISSSSDEGGELLTCFHVKDFTLSFDHTLTVNEAETSVTHILRQGSIALQAESDPGKYDTVIKTINPQPLSFEYMGVIGPCSVDAGGTVTVSAEGFCDVGVVYLNIKESWGKTEGTMTCDDSVVPFSAPGQTFTHSGPSGLGEEFLVTDDSVGHTVMREFLGGEGYHSWTLKTDEFGVVPLIDPE